MKLLSCILVILFGIYTQSLQAAEEITEFNIADRALNELNHGYIHADNHKLIKEYNELKSKLGIKDNRSVIKVIKELDLGKLPDKKKKTMTYDNGMIVVIFFTKFHNNDVYIKIGYKDGMWNLLSFHDQEPETVKEHKKIQIEKSERNKAQAHTNTNVPKKKHKIEEEIKIEPQSQNVVPTPKKPFVPSQLKKKKLKPEPKEEAVLQQNQVIQPEITKKRDPSPSREVLQPIEKKQKQSEKNTENTEPESTTELK